MACKECEKLYEVLKWLVEQRPWSIQHAEIAVRAYEKENKL